jgi:hypothetical protein
MRSAGRVVPLIRPWLWPVAVGLLAVWYTAADMSRHPETIKDFDQNWVAARALVEGQNPYELIGPGRALPFPWPTAYPLKPLLSPVSRSPCASCWHCFAGPTRARGCWQDLR